MECTIQSQLKSNQQLLSLKGELTIYSVADIKQSLLEQMDNKKDVTVNLSGVDEIDSAGLQLLFALKSYAVANNVVVTFSDHSTPVLEAMELLGMTALFGDPVVLPSDNARSAGGPQ